MLFAKYTGIAGLVLLGNISLAQAAPYSIIGSFENPGFPDDPRSLSYLFNNDVTGMAEFGWGVNLDSYQSSRFEFDGASGNAGLPVDSPLLVNLGAFTYTNLQTVRVGNTVTVDLTLTANIQGIGQDVLGYGLEVTNTDSSNLTPDIMQVTQSPDNILFSFEGIDYELAMRGFSDDEGNSFSTRFELTEGSTLNMGIYAELSRVSAVPIPASVWLFGSALLGLVGVARRTRK